MVAGIAVIVDSVLNASRVSVLQAMRDTLENVSLKEMLTTELRQQLVGGVFGNEVLLNETNAINKKLLDMPQLKASYIMAADYSAVGVFIKHRLRTKGSSYKSVYASLVTPNVEGLAVSKKDNQQFWLDNPEALKESLQKGVKEAVALFVADYNDTHPKKRATELVDQIVTPYPELFYNMKVLSEENGKVVLMGNSQKHLGYLSTPEHMVGERVKLSLD